MVVKSKCLQRIPVFGAQRFTVVALSRRGIGGALPEARGNGVERIMKVRPAWGAIDTRRCPESACLAFPSAHRHLGALDLVPRHALEIVIPRIEGADMFKAEPLPIPRAVASGAASAMRRRAELARFRAAGGGTGLLMAMDAAMKPVARAGIPGTHRAGHSKDRLCPTGAGDQSA